MWKRRVVIGSAALVGAAGLAWSQRNNLLRQVISGTHNDALAMSEAPGIQRDACILTPSQEEGPFFVRSPVRSDIREDRKGLRLDLELSVADLANDCAGIEGCVVEIWHCDNAGRYSAYPESISRAPWQTINLIRQRADDTGHVPPVNDKRYLRGAQLTDSGGKVSFTTIFPGCYP